jgi:hypothetical protein
LEEVRRTFEAGTGAGIGFVFTRQAAISGIDLDHCRDKDTGEIDTWARAIITQLDSYSEISPSGTGVHILLKGSLPEGTDGKKKSLKGSGYRPDAAVEIYSAGRYFTCTGQRLPNTPPNVEARQDELLALFTEVFGPAEDNPTKAGRKTQDQTRTTPAVPDCPSVPALPDDVVIDKMLGSANADRIDALFNRGDISAYGNNSSADQALCNDLAFWTGKDREQMDRIFRQSKLMRPKWDKMRGRQTYGQMTINRACTDTCEVYTPTQPGKNEAADQTPSDIQNAGDNILARGQVLKFVIRQFHKNHVGDDVAGKVLTLSYLSGSSLTSNGIQPGITGDAQTGKSDAMDAALHTLPQEWVMRTGLSDKAAAYIEFVPGQVVHSDDLKWTDGLIYMLKISMSKFQVGAEYTTVMKVGGKLKAVPLKIPPRMLWWITGADAAPDDQIESRQYPVDVDQARGHAIDVMNAIASRRASRKPKFYVDKGILTCRYILGQIRESGPFNVEIPYSRWIDYKVPEDYRGQQQFFDLIDALAILNFKQRKVIDGWVQADLQDFAEAKSIFTSKNESHNTGLTAAELQLVRVMVGKGPCTQADLVMWLGKSQSTVTKRLQSIMGKTAYIACTKEKHGETMYRTNKVDMSVFGNVIVGWKKNIPTVRTLIPVLLLLKK